MQKTKNGALFVCLALVCVLTLMVGLFLFNYTSVAKAEETDSTETLNYTLVTNEYGESSYKVAARPIIKSSVTFIRIPETYNGLPITEIAASGFSSCTKLANVVLPNTIEIIGSNAFLNCPKLRTLSLPNVKKIGSNAFALCPLLTNMYFPESVEHVGTNILRNNSNPIYIQSSVSTISSIWDESWNGYYTGVAHFNADASDAIMYYEILDSAKTLIGYGISAYQAPSNQGEDLILYNAIRTEENPEYLPVLTIDSGAFTGLYYNSINIKDIHEVAPSAPHFDNKINLDSSAFYAVVTEEINIEVEVTFEHEKYQGQVKIIEGYDSVVEADKKGNSTKIFEESPLLQRITLPADLKIIPQRAFFNCTLLSEIKIAGQKYNGDNILPNVKEIGSEAFSSCGGLQNITIPSSVEEMGENIFYDWGNGANSQTINVDFYEDEIPNAWNDNFKSNSGLTVNFKSIYTVTIKMQFDGIEIKVKAKSGERLPEFENTYVRRGYDFKGIYDTENETGNQYYNEDWEPILIWSEGDKTELYAIWIAREYNIFYDVDFKGLENPNPQRFTVEDEIVFINLEKEGYTFEWQPASLPKNTTEPQTVIGIWTPITYKITYVTWSGTKYSNPSTYTVEDEIIFNTPTYDGYNVSWDVASIKKGTIGDQKITAIYKEKTLEECRNSNTGIYEIYTFNQFNQINNQSNGGFGKTYKLMKSISGLGVLWNPMAEFKGTLDGNGYSVMCLIINTNYSYVGLFQKNYGVIKNILLDATMNIPEGNNKRVGVFCGINYGEILNCDFYNDYDEGDMQIEIEATSGAAYVGGVAGENYGTISHVNTGTNIKAVGNVNIGGITGFNHGTIEYCYVVEKSVVIAYHDYNYSMGGLVGIQDNGTIVYSGFSGNVTYNGYRPGIYSSSDKDPNMQPCMGLIIGYYKGGSYSSLEYKEAYMRFNGLALNSNQSRYMRADVYGRG